ncbi:MAG: Uma2 family endonuclease [Acidimicrobiales bacterium]
MRTVILGPTPPEVEALIERRQRLGLDGHDEVWEGEYHMAPEAHSRHGVLQAELIAALRPFAKAAGLITTGPFNVGDHQDDFRAPDLGFHRGKPDAVWVHTAAVVVEVLSPDDESYEKFGFYAAHEVDEILIADPLARTVEWWSLAGERYEHVPRSNLLDVGDQELVDAIDWP